MFIHDYKKFCGTGYFMPIENLRYYYSFAIDMLPSLEDKQRFKCGGVIGHENVTISYVITYKNKA